MFEGGILVAKQSMTPQPKGVTWPKWQNSTLFITDLDQEARETWSEQSTYQVLPSAWSSWLFFKLLLSQICTQPYLGANMRWLKVKILLSVQLEVARFWLLEAEN